MTTSTETFHRSAAYGGSARASLRAETSAACSSAPVSPVQRASCHGRIRQRRPDDGRPVVGAQTPSLESTPISARLALRLPAIPRAGEKRGFQPAQTTKVIRHVRPPCSRRAKTRATPTSATLSVCRTPGQSPGSSVPSLDHLVTTLVDCKSGTSITQSINHWHAAATADVMFKLRPWAVEIAGVVEEESPHPSTFLWGASKL